MQEREPKILNNVAWIPSKMIIFRKQSDSMDCWAASVVMITPVRDKKVVLKVCNLTCFS